jgi:D-glucosaminate-6-phosphate ammonia-lyase
VKGRGKLSVYNQLGVKRVVNARGHLTLLGGSILPKEVLEALIEANKCFVDMEELQERSGEIIAGILGAEKAFVTSGAFAALVLATSACMTQEDKARMERLPFTAGMRNEVIIQRGLRTKYDRAITVAGARFVEVGEADGTLPKHVEEAINERTVAIHFLAPGGGKDTVSIETVLRIAKEHNVPVIVDAAGQVLPPENLRKYVGLGADLVCYGAKYFDGPNSAGILCGRKTLVEAAQLQTFVGFETQAIRALGRGMKLDRQEVVGTVVALQRWMTLDHTARLQAQYETIKYLVGELNHLPGVKAVATRERMGIPTRVHVTLSQERVGLTAQAVQDALRNSDPSVWVGLEGETIVIAVETLLEGEAQIILEKMKRILAS